MLLHPLTLEAMTKMKHDEYLREAEQDRRAMAAERGNLQRKDGARAGALSSRLNASGLRPTPWPDGGAQDSSSGRPRVPPDTRPNCAPHPVP